MYVYDLCQFPFLNMKNMHVVYSGLVTGMVYVTLSTGRLITWVHNPEVRPELRVVQIPIKEKNAVVCILRCLFRLIKYIVKSH